MLSINDINNLCHCNSCMADVLIKAKEILIDAVESDLVYDGIDRALCLIEDLEEEMSYDFEELSRM